MKNFNFLELERKLRTLKKEPNKDFWLTDDVMNNLLKRSEGDTTINNGILIIEVYEYTFTVRINEFLVHEGNKMSNQLVSLSVYGKEIYHCRDDISLREKGVEIIL